MRPMKYSTPPAQEIEFLRSKNRYLLKLTLRTALKLKQVVEMLRDEKQELHKLYWELVRENVTESPCPFRDQNDQLAPVEDADE